MLPPAPQLIEVITEERRSLRSASQPSRPRRRPARRARPDVVERRRRSLCANRDRWRRPDGPPLITRTVALATRCPVVIKFPRQTPLTTILAIRLAVEAGLPEDLIQVAARRACSWCSVLLRFACGNAG
ncbi:aldehyde dehydrogenase family protein [Saccharopolyspora sp. NPDC000995]